MKPIEWLRNLIPLVLVLLSTGFVFAQSESATESDDAGESQTSGPVLAIVGGDIETVTQGTIRRGTILIQDGKIQEVGQEIEVPDNAEVIDAAGKVITPGFIALEMSGVGLGPAVRTRSIGSSNKVADALDPFDRTMKFCLGSGITAGAVQVGSSSGFRFRFESGPGSEHPGLVELTLEDLIALVREGQIGQDVLDHLVAHASEHGDGQDESHDESLGLFAGGDGPGMVSPFDDRFFSEIDRSGACAHCSATVIETLPEPLAPPSPVRPRPNNHAVIKLAYGELSGMLLAEDPFYSLPASSLVGPFNLYSWRENVKKARSYLEDLAQYEADKEAGKKDIKEPRKPVDDGLIRLVKKEIPLRISADSADGIRSMVALARELDYRLVIDGGAESWVVAEDLGKAGVPVVLTPRSRRSPQPGREDSTGTSIETPGILQSASVSFAITPLSSGVSLNGLAGRDLTSLPLEAAFAVRGGASESTALAALTIVPARILGLDDRIGSIETGKDADLLVLDGAPLDYRTYVETAIVNGKVRYKRAEDRVYPVFDRNSR
ncbi:amidohydrolase family protein [Tautonia marina]|uniref:amidohydrolase family protein n=1 Tax=Tautonia marina TaxID=2653855 RepID=UPI001260FF2D|nr:amidohydrolase family protein [Tautonia marina]